MYQSVMDMTSVRDRVREAYPQGPDAVVAVIVAVVGELATQVETLSAAVRPLDRKMTDSPGIAGSAILGDGSMVLVLDTAELALMAQRGRRSAAGQ